MRIDARILGIAWLVVVGTGFSILEDYETTAAEPVEVPARWPLPPAPSPAIALDTRLPTLLLFAHPRCPCTRATIGELDEMMTGCAGRVAVTVLFFDQIEGTPGATDTWAETDLWDSAERIPGVRVTRDHGGAVAERFGVTTSGHAVLYDPHGRLLFSGDITPSRGHQGDNAGRARLRTAIFESRPTPEAPVFGCDLRDCPRESERGTTGR